MMGPGSASLGKLKANALARKGVCWGNSATKGEASSGLLLLTIVSVWTALCRLSVSANLYHARCGRSWRPPRCRLHHFEFPLPSSSSLVVLSISVDESQREGEGVFPSMTDITGIVGCTFGYADCEADADDVWGAGIIDFLGVLGRWRGKGQFAFHPSSVSYFALKS